MIYALCVVANIILMSVVFVFARRLRRFDIIDAAWGWAFIVPVVLSYIFRPDALEWSIQTLVTLLVIVWGVRLSWYIGRRKLASDHEDPRYVELRKKWRGNLARNVFLRIYVVQAVLASVIVLPVIYLNTSDYPGWSWLSWTGLVVWVAGFLCESIADRQMRIFMTDPVNQGRLMTSGWWAYSRHPNYFGELLQWWGIFIVILALPFGWVTIVGPLMITYLIVFVSGIPPSERRLMDKPGWGSYRRQTSILIPLPRKAD